MQTTEISHDIDPTLPRAVRAQVQRVRALTAESQQTTEVPNEVTPPSAGDAPLSPETPSPDAPAAQDAPKPSTDDPRHSDPAYWKQRFQVTQGMLDKERRERNHVEGQLRQQISDLSDQVRQAEARQPSQHQADDDIDLTQFFTQEQIEQYGEEQCKTLAQVSMKAGRETAQAAIEDALKPIKQREEDSRQARERDAENAFYDALAEQIPNYQEIDATDAWRKWLAGIDSATGFQRQDILTNHVKRRDAIGTAEMFRQFIEHSARPELPVVPSGSGGRQETPIPASAPKLGYPTKAEIQDFYKRAALGKVKDTERAEFEARLKLQQGPG